MPLDELFSGQEKGGLFRKERLKMDKSEKRRLVMEAFFQTHNGRSTDDVVIDDEVNLAD